MPAMAVKDNDACRPTQSLILTKPRRHFRTIVSPIHWQLRSLIGSDKQSNIVYYPSGKGNLQIKQLNTSTGESETVKLLSFSPRCLVVGNGWICCGGESGEFAAISIDSTRNEANSLAVRLSLDADDRLPLDPSRGDESAYYANLPLSRLSTSAVASRKTFGKERVNCITVWAPQIQVAPFEGAYRQTVAVLANNDRNVTVVSLRDQEALDTVEYPDAVNRAVISPDGQLLAGISDDPYLYIHQRIEKSAGASTSFRAADRPLFEWKMSRRVHLPSQRLDDKSDYRGSFAVCFSNTGRYLAVGTQYGAICILTSEALTDKDADPFLTSFSSSRPNSEPGAVRVLAFCPGPFDLLAWSEDRGNVGVVDIRGDFLTRQSLRLDKESDYEHLDIIDRSSIDPRLLEGRNERDSLASSLATSLDLGSGGSRTVTRWDNPERFNPPFSSDDTIVLEALQAHRRRREELMAAAQTADILRPGYLALESGSVAGSRASLSREPSGRGSRERSASVSRAFSDILTNIRDQRDRLRETQERLRAQAREDVLTQGRTMVDDPRPIVPAAAVPRRLYTPGAGPAETDALPARRVLASRLMGGDQGGAAATSSTTPASSGWLEIEALYQMASAGGSDESASRHRDAGDMRRRDRAALVASILSRPREWESPATRRTLAPYIATATREQGPAMDETAGLAWSEDGRVLFVGAEDGIYEFRVDVFSRKFSPSVTMR